MTNLRLALRQLARSPGFAVVAVLTLALGIGLSASSFSMANAFLLRTIPYPEAGRLVRIFRTSPQSSTLAHAPGNLLDIRHEVTSFEGFALYNGDSTALGEPGQPAEQVNTMAVTADFFGLMGVPPLRGRGFAPGEDEPDQPLVTVLSYRTWMRRYAGDPAVLGRTVRLNTKPHLIVGVMPERFEAPLVWGPVDFFVPRTIHPNFFTLRDDGWLNGVARLKPGVSLAQAQSELDTIAARLVQAYPKENVGLGLRVVGLSNSNMDDVSRTLLWLMTGIALTMMLIACANLASLQVARAFVRTREYAVRAALGGSRRQLMGPLVVESLVLAVAGGVGGLLVAWWSNAIIGANLLINDSPGFEIPIDGRVFGFAVGASLLSGLAFGLAPSWLASRTPAAEALKDGARGSTGGRVQQRLKRALIVGEMALALALVGLAAAFGLGAKSFLDRDLGWRLDGLFNGFVALPYDNYAQDEQPPEFQRRLLERLQTIPGVSHAVLTTALPIYGFSAPNRILVEGQPAVPEGSELTAEITNVTADYFAALGVSLRQGAMFTDRITRADPRVVVINESAARACWPGVDPIGRRLRRADAGPDDWLEVIGVVNDVQMAVRLDQPATRLHLFRPLLQHTSRYFTIVLQSALAPEALEGPVRRAVAALDPDLPVAQPGSLRAQVDRGMSNLNLVIINLALSAGMGLLIACVGLFGVISQLTAQRTRDIGVRMALGAQKGDILRLIMGEGLRLLAWGIVLGVPIYYGLTLVLGRAMAEMRLPGTWLLLTNVAVLGTTMALACFLPARRATRINPTEALRAD